MIVDISALLFATCSFYVNHFLNRIWLPKSLMCNTAQLIKMYYANSNTKYLAKPHCKEQGFQQAMHPTLLKYLVLADACC
jgi:hypothetical protein